jgi:hypothetical protein
MQTLMSGWVMFFSLGSAAAEWAAAVFAWAPETWVLAVWGGVLLLAGRRIRQRQLKDAAVTYYTPASAKGLRSKSHRRAWDAEMAVAPR